MLAPKALELSVLLAAVLLRVLVGLSSYSGLCLKNTEWFLLPHLSLLLTCGAR